jgi:AcrR family transcriptional regulator
VAKRDETKRKIAEAFIGLVERNPIEKVSVAMLVEEMGINRKTFYYHFSDKSDLIVWIFRNRLARLLSGQFSPDQLMAPDPASGDTYPRLPHYVRVKLGIRSLDQSDFFKTLVRVFAEYRDYYLKVFDAPDGMFAKYLAKLYQPSFESDIEFILGGRSFAPESAQFLATYYLAASLAMTRQLLEHPATSDDIDQFLNIAHEGMRHAIEDHPMRRR